MRGCGATAATGVTVATGATGATRATGSKRATGATRATEVTGATGAREAGGATWAEMALERDPRVSRHSFVSSSRNKEQPTCTGKGGKVWQRNCPSAQRLPLFGAYLRIVVYDAGAGALLGAYCWNMDLQPQE